MKDDNDINNIEIEITENPEEKEESVEKEENSNQDQEENINEIKNKNNIEPKTLKLVVPDDTNEY